MAGGKKERSGSAEAGINGKEKSTEPFNPRDLLFDFIAIDVETTGLDPKTDRIIEVGAVRFSAGEPCGEYTTFVNPEMLLPRSITLLTGIQNEDVAGAPRFEEIAGIFLGFIGEMPLCGHQIDFDLNFLNGELKKTGRGKISSPEIDTALLSRIIVPSIGRFSLKHLSNALNIKLENAHRALADAKASGYAACSLIMQCSDLPANIRSAMARFAPQSLLKTLLFKSLEHHKRRFEEIPFSTPFNPQKKLVPLPTPEMISAETIRGVFSNEGGLAGGMNGFIERPSQTLMAQCVTEALNTSSILVAEAGTGTGKSLAYLIPATLYAVKNGTRVLVSTHTRNLQDQLISKDLPLVKNTIGDNVRFSVLKGRSNYLCIRRYHRLIVGDLADLSYRERMGMLPLIRWALETKTGDIEEQNQFNIKWFSRIWRMICADAHLCEGKRCSEFNSCFLQNARQQALNSHIVVINHALFFSELCSQSSFLGPMGAIVFDEAHHLESCGHRHLRVEIDTNRCTQFLDSMAQIEKELRKFPQRFSPEIAPGDIKSTLKRLRQGVHDFLDDCNLWVENQRPAENEYQLAYPAAVFSQMTSYANLLNIVSETQHLLHQLQQAHETTQESQPDERSIRPQLRLLADKTSQLKADLEYVSGALVDDHVFWIEGNLKKGWIKLCGVPLDIGSILSGLWEHTTSGCVFTSATLAVSRSLDYFKQKVGISGPNEAKTRSEIFKSPFSPHQAFRAAMRSSPDADAPEYPGYIASIVAALMSKFNKNILVLFTSNVMLESVYTQCKQLQDLNESNLLAQGITGTRQTILDEFKQSKRCVLLGADSFWEGIDAPGKACEFVIIPRLPFQVPTHPLTKAIAQNIERQAGESFF
jgi:predicted DnaQ family exonuclease/DinG family helicase